MSSSPDTWSLRPVVPYIPGGAAVDQGRDMGNLVIAHEKPQFGRVLQTGKLGDDACVDAAVQVQADQGHHAGFVFWLHA